MQLNNYYKLNAYNIIFKLISIDNTKASVIFVNTNKQSLHKNPINLDLSFLTGHYSLYPKSEFTKQDTSEIISDELILLNKVISFIDKKEFSKGSLLTYKTISDFSMYCVLIEDPVLTFNFSDILSFSSVYSKCFVYTKVFNRDDFNLSIEVNDVNFLFSDINADMWTFISNDKLRIKAILNILTQDLLQYIIENKIYEQAFVYKTI